MTDHTDDKLTPEGIRAIRERLGLSQADAGELLGGGPRAFAKYEGGVIEPAASLVTLLRLLDSNPVLLDGLGRKKSIAVPRGELGPFEVSGRHITELKDRQAVTLLRRLVSAEATAHDIPPDRIHVPSNTNAPDGGEDGSIAWDGDPPRTAYLPSSVTQFQVKTGKIGPVAAGAELLDRHGMIKPIIQQVLERGGAYLLLCFQPYVRAEIQRREERMRKVLSDADIKIADDKIAFRDADQIADWVNRYPSVATWVLEQTQPGALGPFRTWKHWTERPEHEGSPFVDDPRLELLLAKLRDKAVRIRSVVRVVGHSGIGKSRLVQEALGPTTEEEESGVSISSLVMYAVEDEFGGVAIRAAVQKLVDAGTRAIIVVDRCPADTHKIITSMVRRAGSRLSLITIDDEVPPGAESDDLVFVKDGSASEGDLLVMKKAPSEVVEGILKRAENKIRADDHRRLVSLADGYPAIAVQVARNWADDPSSVVSDDALVDRVILGRSTGDADAIRKAAMLLSAFGAVGNRPPADRDLAALAKAKLGPTEQDLRASIEHLLRRGAAQQRGQSISIKPRPIALNLARRQWATWSAKQWEKVLFDSDLGRLNVRAAKQLAYLNTTSIAHDIVGTICKKNGVLEKTVATREESAEIAARLAEIDTYPVVTTLERAIEATPPSEITSGVRRQWVWALEKIAFSAKTFDQGARLLMTLARHETENWDNNATGQFKSLFRVLLGNTEADGRQRLLFIDEFIESDEADVQKLIVEGLISGSRMDSFYRMVGAELQGLRPARSPWRPATWGEVWDYISECAMRLARIAREDSPLGQRARSSLGHSLRSYIGAKNDDLAQRVINEVTHGGPIYWPEAIESLGHVLIYDKQGLSREAKQQVKQFIVRLTPNSLLDRAKHLVTEMAWDYPSDEDLDFEVRGERQRAAIKSFAAEIARQPTVLSQVLPRLSRGNQRMSFVFGEAVAGLVINEVKWLGRFAEAVEGAPESERNFELLAGYCVGLAKRNREVLEQFKIDSVKSPVFARALPLICWRVGITDRDILLVLAALRAGQLEPHELRAWAFGGGLSHLPSFAVAPLFDALMESQEAGYWVGVELLMMYLHGRMQKSADLRPQLVKVARFVPTSRASRADTMGAHNFQTLLKHVLNKGPGDSDARVIAQCLAQKLVESANMERGELYEPLLPILLSQFADLVWPMIGSAILAEQDKRWFFEHALGDSRFSRNEDGIALLSLPVDTLFAWCRANPETAPPFAATVLPLLERVEGGNEALEIHPITKLLIDEFGRNEGVLRGIGRSMHAYSWSGSMTTYYAMYKGPLTSLLDHKIPTVRRWARKALDDIERSIESARVHDADWDVETD